VLLSSPQGNHHNYLRHEAFQAVEMYADYRERRRPPELFWADAIEALHLELELNRRPWECVPATAPLVVLANHPFGIVDGIVLGWIVSQCRSDFQIMTHNVLYRAPEIRHRILPVDFSDNPNAKANNLRSRSLARALLEKGGALVVFPGRGVATAPKLSSQAKERPWGPLAAKLALATGAAVLPVFFHGQNSRLFQIASNIHQVLKYGLLLNEVRNKLGTRLRVTIGFVVSTATLREIGNAQGASAYLKQLTESLAYR
jgi:putative hemolysin